VDRAQRPHTLTINRFVHLSHPWVFLREYTDQIGDAYLIVSPSKILFNTTNAEANTQICARRFDFTKPFEEYDVVNHFGKNVLSAEWEDWRRQRKIIAPAFSEKSNAFVWEQTIGQSQSMLSYWASRPGNSAEEMKVGQAALDTANLALHVICGAGFGVPQTWPHEDELSLGNAKVPGFNTAKLGEGHKLTFKTSLRQSTGIEIVWLTVLPQWLLSLVTISVSLPS
jgi:cytochrome P450